MSVDARTRVLPLVFALLVALVVFAVCTGRAIPAPPASLVEASPVTDFLRYGDSLAFATGAPGAVTVIRVKDGVQSVLRVRSELRLPNTKMKHYARGRIINKFEITGHPSAFRYPVGVGYLWAVASGDSLLGTLFWRNYVNGDTGRTPVKLSHKPLRATDVKDEADCTEENGEVCCLCGDGRRNCSVIELSASVGLNRLTVPPILALIDNLGTPLDSVRLRLRRSPAR